MRYWMNDNSNNNNILSWASFHILTFLAVCCESESFKCLAKVNVKCVEVSYIRKNEDSFRLNIQGYQTASTYEFKPEMV